MATSYPFRPVIIDGLVFCIDAMNLKSYIGSGTSCSNLFGVEVGTLNGGITFTNGTFQLDGIDDHIDFGDILNMNIGSFTIDTFCKLNDNGDFQILVSKRESSGFFIGYEIRCSPSGEFQIILDGVSDEPNRITTTSLYDGQWHHVCAVYDQVSNQILAYIDGELDTSGSSSSTPNAAGSVDNSISFLIGQRGGNYFTNGNISIVRLYNRALSSSEVLQNYEATKFRFI